MLGKLFQSHVKSLGDMLKFITCNDFKMDVNMNCKDVTKAKVGPLTRIVFFILLY